MNSYSPEKFADWDLYWTAFCYVADELSESAKNEFEARLVDDQVAREMVTAVVEQIQGLNQALQPTSTTTNGVTPSVVSSTGKQFSGGKHLGWWVASAVLLLSIGLFGIYILGQPQPPQQLADLQPIDRPSAPYQMPSAPASDDQPNQPSDSDRYFTIALMMDWNLDIDPEIFDGNWDVDPVSLDTDSQNSYKSVSLDENYYWMVEAFGAIFEEDDQESDQKSDQKDNSPSDLFY